MGLHDRIKAGALNGGLQTVPENGGSTVVEAPAQHPSVVDPYAELKTRIHHSCITKLGPQLFSAETTEDLSDQVTRTVTEELTLDKTDRKSTRLNSSHGYISYAVFCL